jgi:ATP-dependent DNA helicase DinG
MYSDMPPADRYLTQDAVTTIRREIDEAYGNEVLFFGWTDDGNRVCRVEVVARGNEVSVAVPMNESFIPDVIIHNHPDGPLSPSPQDIRISSVIAQRGVGFFIINNDATALYVVIEPVKKRKREKLDAERLRTLLSSGSRIAKLLPQFEEREGQLSMVHTVVESFNTDTTALIEAGTGIGKSLAYLVPAIQWSLVNRERVVISTNTINLQEQLLHKDIPDLHDSFEQGFSYVLMKGRGNYVCINRVEEAKQDLFAFIDDEENEEFDTVCKWIERTEDGSLSDLAFIPKTALWEKINSQTETCLGGECGFFSRCFVNRVKRKAVTSNIVVTNHHYLLADATMLGSGMSVLPSYERVIFDEAHNLEDSATSFFTRSITLSKTLRLLGRLYSGGRRKRGYLVYLSRRFAPALAKSLETIQNNVSGLKRTAGSLFEVLGNFVGRLNSGMRETGMTIVEINDEVRAHPHWESEVVKHIDSFYREYSRISAQLSNLRTELEKLGEIRTSKQIEGFVSRMIETVEILDLFLKEDETQWVRWVEDKKEVGIYVAPIEVGGTVNEILLGRVKSAVLTSATLTVEGSFDFLKTRLSLTDTALEQRVDSPFDWSQQMRIIIPIDTVEPGEPGYNDIISEYVQRVLLATGGRAFVLFTSYRLLNEIHSRVKDSLARNGIITFRQGDDSRRNLLEMFKQNISSSLFGTESFWEGVDAPGETLQCVIITKLPFKVPTEPVVRARLQKIAADGGNPFLEYTLPLAVIKLKQGIGRLIRNTKDRGIVMILDPRILRKNYGSVFLKSLPIGNYTSGDIDRISEQVKIFLSNTP